MVKSRTNVPGLFDFELQEDMNLSSIAVVLVAIVGLIVLLTEDNNQ